MEREVVAGGAPLALIREGDGGPVLALALHDGHALRPGLELLSGLSEDGRLREEDPFTAAMAPDDLALIQVLRSRFEVDLNRPRFRCVYQGPEDAWGLPVWRAELPDEHDRISRSVYDAFYAAAFDELSRIEQRHGRFVVLDLHSYNHRRDGVDAPRADEASNPEVNVGTRRLDRRYWAPVVDVFIGSLRDDGLDARENVKFGGGHFAHWVAETFPGAGCALAIEFKKTYMDEWSGAPDQAVIDRNRAALSRAVAVMRHALESMQR